MKSNEPQLNLTGRYNIEETCAFLGIHRHTLRRYTNRGKIRCGYHRVNGRKFYLGSEILRFWRSQL